MVTRRFIATFFPSAEFEVTTRITRIQRDAFRTDGKVLVVPGWMAVYGKQVAEDGQQNLCPVRPGEPARTDAIEVVENVTKPPPHFNEATLLSAMEGAGKLVDDDELREAMSERGLGTPATRAATIEGLIYEQYIARNGRELIATPKGISLIDQLGTIGVELLCSPQMTGEWEYKLKQMEQGKLDRSSFMNDIRKLTTELVNKTRAQANSLQQMDYPDLAAKCPLCGAEGLKVTDNAYQCRSCNFKAYKVVAGRFLQDAEAKELFTKRFVGPLEGFRNRFGQEFNAGLSLDAEGKVAFAFEKSEVQEKEAEALSDDSLILCPCPVCAKAGRKANIYEAESSYSCESVIRGENVCKPKARLSKELCQFHIPREQALKYFQEGRTDVIDKFISKKNRPFSASLVCNVEGKKLLEFDFPPRAPKGEGEDGKPTPARRYPARNKVPAKAPARKAPAKKTIRKRLAPD